VLAFPNAVLAFVFADAMQPNADTEQEQFAFSIWAGFSSVLGFLLFFRSNVAYSRWWEGGTLLQQVRGEWFNAYSSLIAFCSPDPKVQDKVDEFQHLLGRLMSLLFCAALQQVSPRGGGKSFEIIECSGIAQDSMMFLRESSDNVEVIIQWIQRQTILNMSSGVLTVPAPVISRVFQELSRGIVNLQNARKIADFPFPFPYAQTSVVMLVIHWLMCPLISGLLLDKYLAAGTSFSIIFFFWCVNYIALQLEMPYGDRDNDLPLYEMQQDWNRSLSTLLKKYAQSPPVFAFDPEVHGKVRLQMSCELGSVEPAIVGHSSCMKASSISSKDSKDQEMPTDLPPGGTDAPASMSRNSVNHRASVCSRQEKLEEPPPRMKDPIVFHPPDRAPEPKRQEPPPEAESAKGAAVSEAEKVESGRGSASSSRARLGTRRVSAPADTRRILGSQLGSQDAGSAWFPRNSSSSTADRWSRRSLNEGASARQSCQTQTQTPDGSPHGAKCIGSTDQPPPWTLDASGSRRAGIQLTPQCSVGCLHAFGAKLRPAGATAGTSLGS